MNVLFYFGHPAQYHFLKYSIKNLQANSHKVKVLIKTKDVLEDLLKEDGWDYENIQKEYRKGTKLSIFRASAERTREVIRIARSFKADVLVGTDSSLAQAAWLLRKPAITTLEDDIDVIRNLARLTFPFTSSIVVPFSCDVGRWKKKTVFYAGYMKLAYLHPGYFTPDESVLRKYGIQGKFILIRLAKLAAHHDVGINGLSTGLAKDIIAIAGQFGYNAFVSSEVLNPELDSYKLNIRYTDIHHIMSFASLLVSDSQSMSVEAAMLGTPSLRFSDFAGKIGVLEELEHKYELTYGIPSSEPQQLYDKMEELLAMPNLHEVFQDRRQKMLSEKIDVTAFLTWFIENYPESREIMKKNPEYQYSFK